VAHAKDLIIIGAGSLGGRVGARWGELHPEATAVAETRSTRRHESLRAAGMQVRLRDDDPPEVFPNLLFAVPASHPDYTSECERAVCVWSGDGNFVFTSSTAVYAEAEGNSCTEESPLATSERALPLLESEQIVRNSHGIAVRLAGLYDRERGPHRVYLRKVESARRPDGLVNLLHYDDAAALCALALDRGVPGSTYLGCDNTPITRQELVAAAAAAEREIAGAEEARACAFTGTHGPLGRRCDSTSTRESLGWAPEHGSFRDWLRRG